MGEWVSPEDPWPRHTRAASGIRKLRAHGWWLRPSTGRTGKIYGWVRCQPPDGSLRGQGDACEEHIFKTAGDPSDTDAIIDDWIRSCPHQAEVEPPSALTHETASLEANIEAVHFHLDRAEMLCEAIESHRLERSYEERALTLWAQADAATDDADKTLAESLLRRADEQLERAGSAAEQARQAVRGAGSHPEPWPPPAGQLEVLVDGFLEAADKSLPASQATIVAAARERLRALRARLAELRPQPTD